MIGARRARATEYRPGTSGAKQGGVSRAGKNADHLLRSHANSLDAELPAAEVEKVFQVGTQEVDDENVMETLLSKMVGLRNTGYTGSKGKGTHEHCAGCENSESSKVTYGCRSMCGMIDIHRGVEELRTSVVPTDPHKSVRCPQKRSPDTNQA